MGRIATLDGWRAVAILAVVVYHAAHSYWSARGVNEPWIAGQGAMGVDIFFVISGLVITRQLIQEGNLKAFYIRRAFRILPPAFLFLAFVYAAHLISSTDLWRCLLFQRNYYSVSETNQTNHFWTLSLEEQFYLLWPAVFLLAGKRAKGAAFVGVLLVCTLRALVWRPYYHTEMRADVLLWGCVTAFILQSGTVKIAKIAVPICFAAAVAIWSSPFFVPIMPMLLSITVLGTAQNPASILSRILEWRPLVWIGQRSYGIYLWQSLFITAGLPLVVKMVLIFLWPALLYRYFEGPLRQIGRRLAKRTTSPRSVLAPVT